MTVVGTAVITVLADDAGFDASLEEATKPGLKNLEGDADQAGKDVGESLESNIGSGLEGAYQDDSGRWHNAQGQFISASEATGKDAGKVLDDGIKDGLKDAEKDGESAGGSIGKGLQKALSGLSSLLGGVGLEFGPLESAIEKTGEKAGDLEGESTGLMGKLTSLGKVATVAGVVGFAAFSAAALKLGTDFQSSTATMAAKGNIPVNVANQIGKAFLASGSTVVYSAQQQETAFGAVAGQLTQLPGYTMNAASATKLMGSAMDLAEESGGQLAGTTSDLASIMQAFQVPLKGVDGVVVALSNTSRLTGVSVDSLSSTMTNLKAKMGVTAPSIQDMSTLLVDLQDNGVSGSKGLRILNTAMTTLLKPSTDQATAQTNLKAALDALPPSLQKLAAQYQTGTMTAKQVTAATSGLDTAQASLWKQFVTASGKAQTATTAVSALGLTVYNAQGKFVGMGSIIGQLAPKLDAMKTSTGQYNTAAQMAALTQVFGASASKSLLTTVLAGPAAYAKAQAAVNNAAAAHHALQVQQQTLGHEFEAIKVQVVDFATRFGLVLLPIVKQGLHVFADFLGFLESHKPILYAVAGIIGTVLAAAVALYAYSVGVKMVNATKEAVEGVLKMLGVGKEQAAQTEEQGAAADETSTSMEGLTASVQEATASIQEAVAAVQELVGAQGEVAGVADAAAASEEALGAAADTVSASMDAEAVSAGAADAASLPIIATVGLIVAAVALLVIGIYELVKHWHTVWTAVKDAVSDAVHFISGLISDIVDFIKSHWELLLAILTGPIGLAVLFIKDHFTQISKAASDLWHDVTGFFTSMWHDVTKLVSDGVDLIVDLYIKLPLRILSAIAGLFKDIIGAFGDAASWVDSNVIEPVVHYFESLPGRILTGISVIFKDVTGVFSGIATFVSGVVDDIVKFFEALPGRILAAIGNIGSEVLSKIESSVPGGKAVGGVISSIAGAFAEGGMVPGSGPQLALVHGGEYVMSNDDLSKLSSSGGTKNLSIEQALSAFNTPVNGGPGAAAGAANPLSALGATAGKQTTVAPGAINQVFNTPMSASQVADELGWALRSVGV
jgi:hypothetical protein